MIPEVLTEQTDTENKMKNNKLSNHALCTGCIKAENSNNKKSLNVREKRFCLCKVNFILTL